MAVVVLVTVDAGETEALTVRVAVIVEAGAALAVTVVMALAVVVAVAVTVDVIVGAGLAPARPVEAPWLAKATTVMIPATAQGSFADFLGDGVALCERVVLGMNCSCGRGIAYCCAP